MCLCKLDLLSHRDNKSDLNREFKYGAKWSWILNNIYLYYWNSLK